MKLYQAKHEMRYGEDQTRVVKPWPRLQAELNTENKPAFDRLMTDGLAKTSAWPGFERELFARLYTGDKLERLEDVKPEHKLVSKMNDLLDELPDWHQTVDRCKADEYSSTATALGLLRRLMNEVPHHNLDADTARKVQELFESDWMEELDAAGDDDYIPKPDQLLDAEAKLAEAISEVEDLEGDLDESAIRQAVRDQLAVANQEMDDVDAAMLGCGWGSSDAGPGSRSTPEVKRAMADRLKRYPKLKRIMDIAGRLLNFMHQCQSQKIRRGTSEITNIETGAEVGRLLPCEAALVRHPQGRLSLFRKLLERNALQYQLESEEPAGRGPVVVCIDDSASMEGHPEIWSKAVALAMLEMARAQDRPFAYCLFSTRIVKIFVEQPGEKATPAEILDALAVFSAGGTDFDEPLRWALNVIENQPHLEDADIVFISDGDCEALQMTEHRARLESTGARVLGIAVGRDAISKTGPGSMRDFCDELYPVNEIRTDRPSDDQLAATRGVLSL
jgi:uncharacterized protein with von Willebrand factor type A (vWA) domain